MRRQLRSLYALMITCGFVSTAPAVDIFVLTNNAQNDGSANTNFGRIDSDTGSYSSIASLTGDIWNLAWNSTTDEFYATAAVGSANSNLRTLTQTGTLSSSIGSIGRSIFGMAYRESDSTLYAYDYNSDFTGFIDTANGAWNTLNSSPGFSAGLPAGGKYSIMNDTLYFAGWSGAGRFGTMGYTASSTFQQVAQDLSFTYMALANDGTTMYGVYGNGSSGQQRLYTIDVATGARTAGPLITGAGLGTYFHGAAIVPEPSTWALGGIASVAMAWLTKRRSKRSV